MIPSVVNPPYILTLDIGTSSSRAIVFDAAGRAVEGLRAQAAYRMHSKPAGASEMDADVLVEAVAGCIDTVLALAGAKAGQITAVGVCTMWHSVIGMGKTSRAITPLLTWADTRSAPQARVLRERLDPAAYHARTGCVLHPSYLPARLLWLHERVPALFEQVARWVSPGEYLALRLFGEARCSVSMASATGLFNQNACDWDNETLEALPITRERLSPLTDTRDPQTGLIPEWAARWPALAQIPWVPAIGDGAASNVGSGCTTERRMAINLGTSGAIRVCWPATDVAIPPELWCYRLDRQRLVLGAAFSDGGEDYAWCRRTLALPDDAEIERLLAERSFGCHELTFLPYLAGERSTEWRLDARAELRGLTLASTPLDILQAVMEGIAEQFARAATLLGDRFPAADEIIASGGALGASPAWARMLAQALGRPIIVTSEQEASSRGAAITALCAAGVLADEADASCPTGRTVYPGEMQSSAQ